MNEQVVADYATLVPGAKEAVAELRAMGLKIGSTTGYTRSIMERVLPVAAEQGYSPDNLVCADDLPEGRPGPLGMYKCFIDLQVYPPSRGEGRRHRAGDRRGRRRRLPHGRRRAVRQLWARRRTTSPHYPRRRSTRCAAPPPIS
jgi:hypothetical protein